MFSSCLGWFGGGGPGFVSVAPGPGPESGHAAVLRELEIITIPANTTRRTTGTKT